MPPRTRYFLSLLVSWPTTPPITAPPTVPAVLPPVRMLPATPPTPAPIAVSFCCGVMVPQPPSINVVTIALTENRCIAFIENTSLLNIRFTRIFAYCWPIPATRHATGPFVLPRFGGGLLVSNSGRRQVNCLMQPDFCLQLAVVQLRLVHAAVLGAARESVTLFLRYRVLGVTLFRGGILMRIS